MPQKSFDTHLAETGQQTRLNELRRTGGYEAAKRAYEGGGAPTTPKIATQAATTGDKQYGGWYDNPATGRNQRWWGAGVWTDGDDPGAPKSEGDITPFLNKYQDGIFKAKDKPQVKVSTMEELKTALIPEGGYPATFDRIAKLDKLRTERGMEGLEQSLVDLKAQEADVFATLRQRKTGERGKRVATGVIAGRITKVEQQERENLDFIQRQKSRVIDELNMGYSVIKQYMGYYELNYQDAVNKYNTGFQQNFAMYGIILDQEKMKLDQWYKDQAIATTNLQMYMNAVTSGNISYDSMPEEQKMMVAKLEAQSGMPIGFISNLQISPKDQILAFSEDKTQMMVMDGNGGFKTVFTGLTAKGTVAGRTSSAALADIKAGINVEDLAKKYGGEVSDYKLINLYNEYSRYDSMTESPEEFRKLSGSIKTDTGVDQGTVDAYVNMVVAGEMTIANVPSEYRDEVAKKVSELQGQDSGSSTLWSRIKETLGL